jgi:excisionase family DNA binding protein
MTTVTDEYVTAAEAARILGVSRQRVVTLVRKGDINVIRPWPRQVLIRRSDVDAWKAGGRRPSITLPAVREYLTECTDEPNAADVSAGLIATCLVSFIRDRRPEWDAARCDEWIETTTRRLARRRT